ncbi:MAG: alkaline phosphatase family protein [Planctomycetes bacterium]|jgi:alkaline phosphatase D|nr:alkaline phosphatase family protein [Planctomycetota bacterium]MCL4731344.1 alkaline phosphatase family protein [Planctomycetota bacterium]
MTGSARRRVRPIALAVALVLAAALALWAHTRDRAGPGADAEAPPLHPLLRAGPVVGWVEDGRAWLWVQTTRPARVEIALDEHNVQSASTDAAGDHIAVLEFSALAPGRHSLALRLDGEPVGLAPGAGFVVPDATAADFAFTFGSCLWVNDGAHGPGGDFELLDALAAEKADFMLWLGDNVYLRDGDWNSEGAMRARYSHTRAFHRLRGLMASRANFAIWDDHDYGPNDSGAEFALAGQARRVMNDYWPGPDGHAGFAWRDCEFFLLDGRSFRRPPHTLLGAEQLQWLADALAQSRATFKFVACGTQVLNPVNTKEPFPAAELAAVTDAIARRRVGGVVFLSGDRHFAELLRVQPAGCYPLFEFTSSPLSSPNNPPAPGSPEHDNPARVRGTLVPDRRNYGRIAVSGPPGARVLELTCHDKTGAVLWSHRLTRGELAPRE